ncbi:hypothetical protein [uncultured Algibacter sp.]|uniref:type I restriction endonuclease subunit R, EcoR124 family n=1 Tax=uncultured Algibacter sp. TaxID=298659 RepID=UPI0026183AE8|nr:hypothetical protein [uncultured Algibacter sp.]
MTLRSKRELIEQFIENNLPKISNSETIEDEFKIYWEAETKKALQDLSKAETLRQDKVESIINDFLFTGRMATEDEVIEALEKQPSVLQRESISIRITEKINPCKSIDCKGFRGERGTILDLYFIKFYRV